MAKENYSNEGSATLNGSITSSATSISVHTTGNYSLMPTTGQFTVRIDDEIILVTANNGTGTLTVTRAQEGTTGATHADLAPVKCVLTDGSLRRLVRVSGGGSLIGARREVNFIAGSNVTLTLTDDSTNDKVDVTVAASGGGSSENTFSWALAIGTLATTGSDLANWAIAERAYTLSKAYAVAKTAPTGADLKLDILVSTDNGSTWTSLWHTTPTNALKITAGNHTSTQTTFDITALSEGDLLRIDITQIGSTVAGKDITVKLKGT